MRILGLDPGTATLGWGIIEVTRGGTTVLGYGHISTEKECSPSERLCEIAKDLETLIERFEPDEAAVEELFFAKNQTTVISVSQARGVILLILERMGVSPCEYTPMQVKQALTNYGKADKTQVQHMVKHLLRLKEIPRPDDAADALGLALCHLSRRRMENVKKTGHVPA